MKKVLLFLLLIIPSFCIAQEDTPKPGPGFEDFRLPKDGSTMRNESVCQEAVDAGWGSSIWDKGPYYPGMDVEEVRTIYRNDFFTKLAIILICIIAASSAAYGLYRLFKNRKKRDKESSKELLIYYKSIKPHHSCKTESSDQDQGNYQPS